MKNLFVVFALVFSTLAFAQLETPQPSPFSKLEQKVGLTDVTVEYCRPSTKGRKIYGNLVPFDKVWRTGANGNTKVTFSDDVTVGDKELKAGTYALYTKPGKSNWDFIFYSTSDNWGTPKEWDDAKVAARVSVKAETIPMKVETFTITIDDLTNDAAVLGLIWENTFVGVKFNVPTKTKAVANIEKALTKTDVEAGDYFASARYYLESDLDINKAMKWIETANDLTKDSPKFWYKRLQSLIYAKAGKTRKAIKAAKESLEGAEKAGNTDYVKMNQDSIEEWTKK